MCVRNLHHIYFVCDGALFLPTAFNSQELQPGNIHFPHAARTVSVHKAHSIHSHPRNTLTAERLSHCECGELPTTISTILYHCYYSLTLISSTGEPTTSTPRYAQPHVPCDPNRGVAVTPASHVYHVACEAQLASQYKSGPSSPAHSAVTGIDALQSPHEQHQPLLRTRLQALLHHTDSHSSSSPIVSPYFLSETPSQHDTNPDPQSSSTSVDSLANASAQVRSGSSPLSSAKRPKGLVMFSANLCTTASSVVAPLTTSPPPKLAALPRSATTSQLDQAAIRTQLPTPGVRQALPDFPVWILPTLPADLNVTTAATASGSTAHSQAETRQRPSIKVRIITWNMHDSVPKGDLQASRQSWSICCA